MAARFKLIDKEGKVIPPKPKTYKGIDDFVFSKDKAVCVPHATKKRKRLKSNGSQTKVKKPYTFKPGDSYIPSEQLKNVPRSYAYRYLLNTMSNTELRKCDNVSHIMATHITKMCPFGSSKAIEEEHHMKMLKNQLESISFKQDGVITLDYATVCRHLDYEIDKRFDESCKLAVLQKTLQHEDELFVEKKLKVLNQVQGHYTKSTDQILCLKCLDHARFASCAALAQHCLDNHDGKFNE